MNGNFNYKTAVRLDMLDRKSKLIDRLNTFALLAILFSCAIGILLNYLLRMLGEPGGMYFVYSLAGMALCVIYIYVHELAHALCILVIKGRAPEISFGRLAASCGSRHIVFTKPQYAAVALFPLVFFSCVLLPLIILLPPMYFPLPFMPMSYNVFGSLGDVMMVHKMLRSPRGSVIIDSGTETSAYMPEMQ